MNLRMPWLSEQLLASQQGLCSVELVMWSWNHMHPARGVWRTAQLVQIFQNRKMLEGYMNVKFWRVVFVCLLTFEYAHTFCDRLWIVWNGSRGHVAGPSATPPPTQNPSCAEWQRTLRVRDLVPSCQEPQLDLPLKSLCYTRIRAVSQLHEAELFFRSWFPLS
jgi:hypothetical protein